LAAQLGVLPLIIYLFGEISVIAPLTNLFIAPLIPFAMLLITIAVVLSLFSWQLGMIAGFVAYVVYHWSLQLIALFASFPWAMVSLF